MSDNTTGGVYCSVCHKRRPATHFEDRPDHAAGGPKLTLAERRELGEDLDGYTPRAPRPRTPRQAPSSTPAQGDGSGWGALAVAGGIFGAFLGGLWWIARHLPPAA